MQRRTLLKLGASSLAVGAIGVGLWVQHHRRGAQRRSDPILGRWPELGPEVNWLLPGLVAADMYVPDRPHAMREDDAPESRLAIRRFRHFQVNSSDRRLRGGDFPQQPASGVFRILAIGDSTTFGWGVEDQQAWPAQLEAKLAARGREVQVLNAGVPNLGYDSMAAYLRVMAPALGLHGVVISRRPNVPFERSGFAEALRDFAEKVPGVRLQMVLPPVSRFDLHGQRVWEQEQQAVSSALAGDPGVPVLELTPLFQGAQGQRGYTLVERSGRLLVVSLESGETVLEAKPTERDLPPAIYQLFERDTAVAEPLIFDGGHMDAEGCALAAGWVADELERQGWWS